MTIDLKNPEENTIEKFRRLVASVDDTKDTQFRVTEEGILFLSEDVGNRNLDNILFRLETNGTGNGYVGAEAAKDELWLTRLYKGVNDNWPKPKSTYIDNF